MLWRWYCLLFSFLQNDCSPLKSQTHAVSKAVKEFNFDKALELRGHEFQEMLVAFHAVSSFPDESSCLPVKRRMRIGFAQSVVDFYSGSTRR